MLLFLGVWQLCANAQSIDETQPIIPEASVAAESDPEHCGEPRESRLRFKPWYGTYLSVPQEEPTHWQRPRARGFGLGLHHTKTSAGTSWSLTSASSLELGERFRAGFLVDLPMGDAARKTSFDVGLAWRPSPWFGAGVASRNLGATDVSTPNTALGIAVRPGVEWLTLGLDAVRSYGDPRRCNGHIGGGGACSTRPRTVPARGCDHGCCPILRRLGATTSGCWT